jgi:2-C-methyl-D-erythritol 2,4-cyclodiphosphate synthase
MRGGFGFDSHRLTEGRRLVLGGVDIPSPKGEDGHSDGDVLIHAVIDALFGAACSGDIGSHFPPSDPAYKDIGSLVLLTKAVDEIRKSYRIVNIDCTVILERPKILPFVSAIRSSLAPVLGIGECAVSVKGKTKEGLDAAGEGKSIEAYATVLLEELSTEKPESHPPEGKTWMA